MSSQFSAESVYLACLFSESPCLSDSKLKQNIKPLHHTLSNLDHLHGVSFEWKSSAQQHKKEIGVLAQDVERVYPELVVSHPHDNGYKRVDYSKLTAVLIEALKELKAETEELKGRIKILEKKK